MAQQRSTSRRATRSRSPIVLFCTALAWAALGQVELLADEARLLTHFQQRIEPVLREHCYSCHSGEADSLEANLRLDYRDGLLAGGDSGPAVDLEQPRKSLLLAALRHEDGLEMPPDRPPLPDQVVADFEAWIRGGLIDSRPKPANVLASSQAARQHWAFQAVSNPKTPDVANRDWPRTPIDHFILAELERRNWQPAPPAPPRTWLRRVYFDLIGLPPSPEAVAAFLRDPSQDARARVVDDLLNRPEYGERWAQHWLDVVRYAETEGFEYDRHLPDAWRYRDYVIRSLNEDKPFDQFVTEQLAGDEIAPADPEVLAAVAFHRLGPVRRNAGNPEIALSRNEVLTERTNIIGDAFLGLTVGCARCHNHKLEPISQQDYYRLQAYFAATAEHNVVLAPDDQQQSWERETERLKKEIAELKARAKRTEEPGQKQALMDEADQLELQLPPHLPTIPGIRNDFENATPIHVLRRGDWDLKGPRVGPRPPSVLVADDMPELPADASQPRLQLARWMTRPDHPLTARVIVNRLWQHHFGQGLVRSPNDFGTHGDSPSHPALLDWLATSLVEHEWRLKPMHRMLVLSQTYAQASESPQAAKYLETDPDNRWLWRFSRRRLSAEEIRDTMLLVAGRLNRKAGGPSVIVPVDESLVQLLYKPTQWQVSEDPSEHDRRSIYLIAKRNLRLPFMEVFDSPALQTSCPQRETSTHAPQALNLLNDPFTNSIAVSFARRLQTECGGDPERLVERAFQLALGRSPTASERSLSVPFVREQPLREFALAVINLNSFLYVE